MRTLWLFSILLLLAGPTQAAGPTPLQQVLPVGEETLIACRSPYQIPAASRDWPPDNLFHYRLYLPVDYDAHGQQPYPLMFIASPSGNARMGAMAARLKRDRWLVAMLVESRNRSMVWLPNFMAAYHDVTQRVRVQQSMIFCTGFSGGARVCGSYPRLRPGFQGLLLQAAGFQQRPVYLSGANAYIAVYGTFGNQDRNRREARRIRAGVPPHTRTLVELWEGGHSWAPVALFNRALDWLEEKALLDQRYQSGLSDVYAWYLHNQLALYAQAGSDIERYAIYQRISRLPERWKEQLDATTTSTLSTIAEAMRQIADRASLQQEIAAYHAFHKTLRLDERGRGRNLPELIKDYGEMVERYGQTIYAKQAASRQQSVRWEHGEP